MSIMIEYPFEFKRIFWQRVLGAVGDAWSV